ncbi:oligosaccharide flippase family protein [Bradyrhizobium diazoefficiens]|nr:oligosaccharide flippase family protein [Bradyrhizobium diazoefficiens]MBR0704838.1 oligosaccharide flippase family protein [Bradyrhizobium diazoefficiens]MBR0773187.1 oligosaccharide flippase family protein [Bradyrhizobium diazoefficiens]
MKSGSRLLANSTWNAAAFLLGVGLNLVTLPFVIRRLGVGSFGIAGLVTACIAPALIFSSSLALMIARELAQRLVSASREEATQLFATALFLSLAFGAPIAALLLVAGPAFARHAFNLGGDLASDLFAAFSFGVIGWLCQCVSGVFLALFVARQDYARLALVNITGTVCSTVLMLVLIPRWPFPSTFIACQTAGFAAILMLSVLLSRLSLFEWVSRPMLHRIWLTNLLHTGKWQVVAQGGGLISGQADRYLLGAFLQPQSVGYYVIAQRLEEAIYIGVLKIGEILFPFFSSLHGQGGERVTNLFFRAAWVSNVLAVGVLGALIPVAGNVLYLWTGAEVAAEGQRVLIVLAVAGILGSGTNVFAFYLLANGRTGTNAAISLVTALFTLGTSAVALPYVGWPAAGWSSCVGALAQIVVMTLLLRRTFDLPDIWWRVWHFVLMPIVVGVACAILLRFLIAVNGFGQNAIWWLVAGLYGASAAMILAVVVSVSSLGPYGEICRRDLQSIVARFLPARGI